MRHLPQCLTAVLLTEVFLFPHAGQVTIESEAVLDASASSVPRTISEEPFTFEEPRLVQALPVIGTRVPRLTHRVVITAYSSTVDQTDDTPFITANGTRVRDGIIAANFLRFGTQVRIPELYGDKLFHVHDRMHERFAHRVDIWMETREEAREFGVKVAKIEIY